MEIQIQIRIHLLQDQLKHLAVEKREGKTMRLTNDTNQWFLQQTVHLPSSRNVYKNKL